MRNFLSGLLWIVVPLALILGLARLWVIDVHRVSTTPDDPSNWANSPTLEPGDRVLVWRVGTPHVGSLVRCRTPDEPSGWLVGRVAATGGDKVELQDGQLRINNYRVVTSACQKPTRPIVDADGNVVELACQAEELGGSKHDTAQNPLQIDQPITLTVPHGRYFLLSDNRAAPWARDSRQPEIGPIPAENCTERLVLRLWSAQGWSDAERRLNYLP